MRKLPPGYCSDVPRIVKWLLVGVGMLLGLGALAVIGVMVFVFSIGTATVDLDVNAIVRDKDTRQPVHDCLLAFEKGFDGSASYGTTAERTNREGRSDHRSQHQYVGSMLWPFDRARKPVLRFYVGAPPRYDVDAPVESWHIRLLFEEPWTGREVSARAEVERSMARDTSYVYKEGDPVRRGVAFDAIPGDDLAARVQASVHTGGRTYRIPLTILLDKDQIATCQAKS